MSAALISSSHFPVYKYNPILYSLKILKTVCYNGCNENSLVKNEVLRGMSKIKIEDKLFKVAKDFIEKRYPTGWGGAAVMYSKNERIYTSVAPEVINASTELCMETGSILEAHKYKDVITHSICVVRNDEKSNFKILTPCGTCQERLLYWGNNIKVGITTENNKIEYKTLKELQPHHWTNAYDDIKFHE